MKTLLPILGATCLILTGPGCLKQNLTPHEILDRAIAAQGGKENILKRRFGVARGVEKGPDLEFNWEETFAIPGKWLGIRNGRMKGRQQTSRVLVRDGRISLRVSTGETDDRKATEEEDYNPIFRALVHLLELRQGEFKLTALPEIEVKGEAAAGFHLVHEFTDRDFFFRKKDWLVVKTVTRPLDEHGKPRYVAESYFSDHRDVDGAHLPHRMETYLFNELAAEWTLKEVKIMAAIDDKVFDIP